MPGRAGEGIKLGALQVLGWPADGQGGDDTAEMIKDWRRDMPQILDELPVIEREAMLSDLVMVTSVRLPWLFSHLSTTFARARQTTLVANVRIDSIEQAVGGRRDGRRMMTEFAMGWRRPR